MIIGIKRKQFWSNYTILDWLLAKFEIINHVLQYCRIKSLFFTEDLLIWINLVNVFKCITIYNGYYSFSYRTRRWGISWGRVPSFTTFDCAVPAEVKALHLFEVVSSLVHRVQVIFSEGSFMYLHNGNQPEWLCAPHMYIFASSFIWKQHFKYGPCLCERRALGGVGGRETLGSPPSSRNDLWINRQNMNNSAALDSALLASQSHCWRNIVS